MITRRITLVFIIFLSIQAFAQDLREDMYYKRYQGNIGENINVTANIVRLYDNISGNYVYYFYDENNELYYGNTIELSGGIDQYDSLKLREFGSDEFTFIGLLSDNHYNGVWNADDEKAIDFKMKEYYPNGSLGFEVYYLKSESKLDNTKSDSPLAEIELTLIYPNDEYFQIYIIDSVKRIITKSYFGKGFTIDRPQNMLEAFEKEYVDDYNKKAKIWHETRGESFSWEKMMNMSVIYNSNYLLCTEYLRYAYAGGDHGMSNLSFDIIDLNDGNKLYYDDIFMDDIDSTLTLLLTKQLREDYQIPDEVSLKNAGFFVEDVKPNKNLFIDAGGVGFVYNSYEIAPSSRGATRVLLSFESIKHLVKKGTPVFKLSHR